MRLRALPPHSTGSPASSSRKRPSTASIRRGDEPDRRRYQGRRTERNLFLVSVLRVFLAMRRPR